MAKDKLPGLVEEAEKTHEIVTITRHGRPAAAADDLESLEETLYWLLQPGIHEDIAEARREYERAGARSSSELVRIDHRAHVYRHR